MKNQIKTKAKETRPSETQEMEITTEEPKLDLKKIRTDIVQVIKLYPELEVSVSFKNVKTDESLDVEGNKFFVAASTIKILVAADFLHQVELGKYSLETKILNNTARYHLEQMIRWSNNDSWYAFNDKLGGYKGESDYAKTIGIDYDWKTNSINANGMTLLFSKLYRYELLSQEHTDLLFSFMDKTKLMKLIPESAIPAKTYNKSGRISGYIHDVAILDDGENKYALAIFTNGRTSTETRAEIFHQIAEIFYKY